MTKIQPNEARKNRCLEKIRELLPEGNTLKEIAAICEVPERTFYRYHAEWRDSGGFEAWLQEEFFSLHKAVKENAKVTAYKEICALLARTIKRRIESELKGDITVRPDITEILREYNSLFEDQTVATETVAENDP